MESDPQVVVALAALAIKTTATPVASTSPVQTILHRHDTLPVLVSTSTAEGISTVPDEPTCPTNDRVVGQYEVDGAVLDAFASIAVNSTASQCVAVALEIDVSKHVAVLTIAGITGKQQDLIAYLNGIWRLMSVMSNRCVQLKRNVDLTAPSCVQPQISVNAAIEPWRTEFVKRVYLHCTVNQIALLRSRWENLRRFVLRFQLRPNKLSGDSTLQSKFTDGVCALGATYSLLQTLSYAPYLSDTQWRDLICLMDGTVSDIGTVLADQRLCDEWTKEIQRELLLVPCFPYA